ncbi:MAG: hypothetical protein NZM11_11455 [Anaerolineales bacterium]|nr:hypothetical protein [Anaerolineales bacterium]MDW8325870.1 hypothetical protein [Anaerolineales bacterium]
MSSTTSLSPLVEQLKALGLNGLAASLLETGGPLTFLSAQALHALTPLAGLLAADEMVSALAVALEDPQAARQLAQQLTDP